MGASSSTIFDISFASQVFLFTGGGNNTPAPPVPVKQPANNGAISRSSKDRLADFTKWLEDHPYSRAGVFLRSRLNESGNLVISAISPANTVPPLWWSDNYATLGIEPYILTFYGDSSLWQRPDAYFQKEEVSLLLSVLDPIDISICYDEYAMYVIARDGSLWSVGIHDYKGTAWSSPSAMDSGDFAYPPSDYFHAGEMDYSPRTVLKRIHDGPFVRIHDTNFNMATFFRHEDGSWWASNSGNPPRIDLSNDVLTYDQYAQDFAFQKQYLTLPTCNGDRVEMEAPFNQTHTAPTYFLTPTGNRRLERVLGSHITALQSTYNQDLMVAVTENGGVLFWGKMNGLFSPTFIARYQTAYGLTNTTSSDLYAGTPISLELPGREYAVSAACCDNRIVVVTNTGKAYGIGSVGTDAPGTAHRFGGIALPTVGNFGSKPYDDKDSWVLLYDPQFNAQRLLSDVFSPYNTQDIYYMLADEPGILYAFGSGVSARYVDASGTKPKGGWPWTFKVIPAGGTLLGFDRKYIFWKDLNGNLCMHLVNTWPNDTDIHNVYGVRAASLDGQDIESYANSFIYENNGKHITNPVKAIFSSNDCFYAIAPYSSNSAEYRYVSYMDIEARHAGVAECLEISSHYIRDAYAGNVRADFVSSYMAPFIDVTERYVVFPSRASIEQPIYSDETIDSHHELKVNVTLSFAIDFIQSVSFAFVGAESFNNYSYLVSPSPVEENISGLHTSSSPVMSAYSEQSFFHTDSTAVVYYSGSKDSHSLSHLIVPSFSEVFSFSSSRNNVLSGVGRVPILGSSPLALYGPTLRPDPGYMLPLTFSGPHALKNYPTNGVKHFTPTRHMQLRDTAIVVDNNNQALVVAPDNINYQADYWFIRSYMGSLFSTPLPNVRGVFYTGAIRDRLGVVYTNGDIDFSVDSYSTALLHIGGSISIPILKVEAAFNTWTPTAVPSMIILGSDGEVYGSGSVCGWANLPYYNSLQTIYDDRVNTRFLRPDGVRKWVDIVSSFSPDSPAIYTACLASDGRLFGFGPDFTRLDSYMPPEANPYAGTLSATPYIVIDTDVREARLAYSSATGSYPTLCYTPRMSIAYLKKGQLHLRGTDPRVTADYRHISFKVASESSVDIVRNFPYSTEDNREAMAAVFQSQNVPYVIPVVSFGPVAMPLRLHHPMMQNTYDIYGDTPTVSIPVLVASGWEMRKASMRHAGDDVLSASAEWTGIGPLPASGGLVSSTNGRFRYTTGDTSGMAWHVENRLWKTDMATGNLVGPYVFNRRTDAGSVPPARQAAPVNIIGARVLDNGSLVVVYSQQYTGADYLTHVEVFAITCAIDDAEKTIAIQSSHTLYSTTTSETPVPATYGYSANMQRPAVFDSGSGRYFIAVGPTIYSTVDGLSWSALDAPWADTPTSQLPSGTYSSPYVSAYARLVKGLYISEAGYLYAVLGCGLVWKAHTSDANVTQSWVWCATPDYMDPTHAETPGTASCRIPEYIMTSEHSLASIFEHNGSIVFFCPSVASYLASCTIEISSNSSMSRLTRWGSGYYVRDALSETPSLLGPVVPGDYSGVLANQDGGSFGRLGSMSLSSICKHDTHGLVCTVRDTAFVAHTVISHPEGRQFIAVEEMTGLNVNSCASTAGRRGYVLIDDIGGIFIIGTWNANDTCDYPSVVGWSGVQDIAQGNRYTVYVRPVKIGTLSGLIDKDIAQLFVIPEFGAYSFTGVFATLYYGSDQSTVYESRSVSTFVSLQEESVQSHNALSAVTVLSEAVAAKASVSFASRNTEAIAAKSRSDSYPVSFYSRAYLAGASAPKPCTKATLGTSLLASKRTDGVPCVIRSARIANAAAYASSPWAISTDTNNVVEGSSVRYLPIKMHVFIGEGERSLIGFGTASSSTTDPYIEGAVQWWLATDYLEAVVTLGGLELVLDFGEFSIDYLSSFGAVSTSYGTAFIRTVDAYVCVDGNIDELDTLKVSVAKADISMGVGSPVAVLRMRERSNLTVTYDSGIVGTGVEAWGSSMSVGNQTTETIMVGTSDLSSSLKSIAIHAEHDYTEREYMLLPQTVHLPFFTPTDLPPVIDNAAPYKVARGKVFYAKVSGFFYNSQYNGRSIDSLYVSADGRNWRVFPQVENVTWGIIKDAEALPLYDLDYGIITVSDWLHDEYFHLIVDTDANGRLSISRVSPVVTTLRDSITDGFSPNAGVVVHKGGRSYAVLQKHSHNPDTASFIVWDVTSRSTPFRVSNWTLDQSSKLSLPWAKAGSSLPGWVASLSLYPDIAYLDNTNLLYAVTSRYEESTYVGSYVSYIASSDAPSSAEVAGAVRMRVGNVSGHEVTWLRAYGYTNTVIQRHAQYPSLPIGIDQVRLTGPDGTTTVILEAVNGVVGHPGIRVHPDYAPVPVSYFDDASGNPKACFVEFAYYIPLDNVAGGKVLVVQTSIGALIAIYRTGLPVLSYWVQKTSTYWTQNEIVFGRRARLYSDGLHVGTPARGIAGATYSIDVPNGNVVLDIAGSSNSMIWLSFLYNGTYNYGVQRGGPLHESVASSLYPSVIPISDFLTFARQTYGCSGNGSPYTIVAAFSGASYHLSLADARASARMPLRSSSFEIDFKLQVDIDSIEFSSEVFGTVYQQLTDTGRTVTGSVVGVGSGALVVALTKRKNSWVLVDTVAPDGTFSLSVPETTERIYLVVITDQGAVGKIVLEA